MAERTLGTLRRAGPRGISWGYRFWRHRRLYQRFLGPGATKRLAQEAERRARHRLLEHEIEGRWGAIAPSLTSWAEALRRYEFAKRDRRDLRLVIARLRWWARWAETQGCHYIQTLDPETVDRGREALAARLAPQTVHHYLGVLRAFYGVAARRWGLLRDNPVLRVDWPKVVRVPPRLPTPTEVNGLLQACEPQLRRLVLLALQTGIRQEALIRLTADDFAKRGLRAHDRKGGRTYWIPLARQMWGQNTAPWPWRRFPRRAWNEARTKAGVPWLTFHRLRHWVASRLAEEGTPPRTIQAYLGHRSGAATAIYTHATDDALAKAARTIDRTIAAGKWLKRMKN